MAEGRPSAPSQSRDFVSEQHGGSFHPKISSVDQAQSQSHRVLSTAGISNETWQAIENGASINELIDIRPEDVISALRDHSIKKLATFTLPEQQVLLAFGERMVLTRGFETLHDDNCVESWRSIIAAKVETHQGKMQATKSDWDPNVTVVAYAVKVKNAAAGQSEGLLYPLVQKSLSGAAAKEVWEFDAVEAVVEYKWRHWARRYLLVEFVLYLGWVISFSIFLLIYIENNVNEEGICDEDGKPGMCTASIADFIFDVLSVLFMLPFLLIEFKSIIYYGRKWFQVWNLLDFVAYVLQFCITFVHLFIPDWLDSKGYNTILAVQCTLLYVKVQYFSRFFGSGSAFLQLIARVMTRVRGYLIFITLTMVSAALSFAVLYRQDRMQKDYADHASPSPGDSNQEEEEDDKDTDEDFGSSLRALVTIYAVLLGDFDSAYVFETSNRVVKGIFFLFFQVMMSITVLNILIAVMTESYTSIVREERVMNNMGRAQVMDELEIAMPKRWGPHLKPYCHFLKVEREAQKSEDETAGGGLVSEVSLPPVATQGSLPSGVPPSHLAPDSAVHKEILDLKRSVNELKELVQALKKN